MFVIPLKCGQTTSPDLPFFHKNRWNFCRTLFFFVGRSISRSAYVGQCYFCLEGQQSQRALGPVVRSMFSVTSGLDARAALEGFVLFLSRSWLFRDVPFGLSPTSERYKCLMHNVKEPFFHMMYAGFFLLPFPHLWEGNMMSYKNMSSA